MKKFLLLFFIVGMACGQTATFTSTSTATSTFTPTPLNTPSNRTGYLKITVPGAAAHPVSQVQQSEVVDLANSSPVTAYNLITINEIDNDSDYSLGFYDGSWSITYHSPASGNTTLSIAQGLMDVLSNGITEIAGDSQSIYNFNSYLDYSSLIGGNSFRIKSNGGQSTILTLLNVFANTSNLSVSTINGKVVSTNLLGDLSIPNSSIHGVINIYGHNDQYNLISDDFSGDAIINGKVNVDQYGTISTTGSIDSSGKHITCENGNFNGGGINLFGNVGDVLSGSVANYVPNYTHTGPVTALIDWANGWAFKVNMNSTTPVTINSLVRPDTLGGRIVILSNLNVAGTINMIPSIYDNGYCITLKDRADGVPGGPNDFFFETGDVVLHPGESIILENDSGDGYLGWRALNGATSGYASNTFVPYLGATSDLNMNGYGITAGHMIGNAGITVVEASSGAGVTFGSDLMTTTLAGSHVTVPTPSSPSDAVNKSYSDALVPTAVATANAFTVNVAATLTPLAANAVATEVAARQTADAQSMATVSSGYVPYTGASSNVSLGTNSIYVDARSMPGSPVTTGALVFAGDSRTVGWDGVSIYGWTNNITPPSGMAVSNIAMGGDGTYQALQRGWKQADDIFKPRSQNNLVILWIGYNDFPGYSANFVEAQIAQYCRERHALGYSVLVCTEVSARYTESYRIALNVLIKKDYWEYADGLIDLAANPNLGPLNACENPTYFYAPDGVHLTNAGYDIVTGIMQTSINSFLAPSSRTPLYLPLVSSLPSTIGSITSNSSGLTLIPTGATQTLFDFGSQVAGHTYGEIKTSGDTGGSVYLSCIGNSGVFFGPIVLNPYGGPVSVGPGGLGVSTSIYATSITAGGSISSGSVSSGPLTCTAINSSGDVKSTGNLQAASISAVNGFSGFVTVGLFSNPLTPVILKVSGGSVTGIGP